ncbi:MAG: DMT family transporter, partial [Paracoccus sp. (in: a-proteobacteria)]|nr:DMT family transporter [Paracoccus sp. (in: a-proteobacteria)]
GGFFIGPVVSYLLAALLLRERVTWARFALLLLGFVGVLMVVQPGAGMGRGMGFALLAGCFYGGYLTATRWLAGAFRPRFLLASQLLIGSVLLAVPGLPQAPGAFDATMAALILGSAAASALGNYMLVRVSRTTLASVIAPLIYVQLIAAAFLGVVVFGDWPDTLALAGLAVIVGTGLAGLALVRGGGFSPPAKATK